MDKRIKQSLIEEKELLNELLEAIDAQFIELTSNEKNPITINSCAEKIDSIAKKIAFVEIERRKIISKEDLAYNIESSYDEGLKEIIRDIKNLINLIEKQNKMNNSIIKNNLLYTRKILKMITPSEKFDTYNSEGKLGR